MNLNHKILKEMMIRGYAAMMSKWFMILMIYFCLITMVIDIIDEQFFWAGIMLLCAGLNSFTWSNAKKQQKMYDAIITEIILAMVKNKRGEEIDTSLISTAIELAKTRDTLFAFLLRPIARYYVERGKS